VAALESRDFEFVLESRADYFWTHLAVPSMLDQEIITDAAGLDPSGHEARRRAYASRTFARLRDAGYEIITTATGWEQSTLRGADRFFDPGQITDFEIAYLQTIGLQPVLDTVMPWFLPEMQRQRVGALARFVEAEATATGDRPRFILAHFPIPHPPFVYGPDGEPRDPPLGLHHYFEGGRSADEARAAYLHDFGEQTSYADHLLLRMVDAIIAGSRTPPVIIIVSDHGSRSTYDLRITAENGVEESSANLVAVHAPGHPDLLPDGLLLHEVLAPILDAYVGVGTGQALPTGS
jgi:hypothetical protein